MYLFDAKVAHAHRDGEPSTEVAEKAGANES